MKLFKIQSRGFCKWQPKVPKHKIILDPTSYRAPHPIWNAQDAETVEITHFKPVTFKDRFALLLLKVCRFSFDFLTKYKPGKVTEYQYIRRCIFLETVAGVPGIVGGMLRHLKSLRSLQEDGGWIHHLLEEAENERIHLLTFLKIRQPSLLVRFTILYAQFFFICYYGLLYLISPKTAHRFVGYLEEEAVKTYTNLLKEIDEGKLPFFTAMKAPPEAVSYWKLGENATFRDIIISIRADECAHREFNHHFADVDQMTYMEAHKIVMGDKPIIWNEEEEKNIAKQLQQNAKL